MQKVLTAEEMREVDRLTTEKYGIPSILLMENAAHATARIIAEKLGGSVKGKSFLILCGKGNNGGDGAALARILAERKAVVFAMLFGEISETQGDAKVNFSILRNLNPIESGVSSVGYESQSILTEVPVKKIEEAWNNLRSDSFDVIVDGIFGTGLDRKIVGGYQSLIKQLQFWSSFESERTENLGQTKRPVFVSLDIPSGIHANSGELLGVNFEADLTVTFTSPKMGNVLPPASRFNGELRVENIGSPSGLVDSCKSNTYRAENIDAWNWLLRTKFLDDSYKSKRGNALLIVGSKNYSGAAVLAGNAAMQSGVGLVTVATSESAHQSVSERVLPEVMVQSLPENEKGFVSEAGFEKVSSLSEKADVVAIGSGLGSIEESTRNLVRRVVEERTTTVVIDADGLNSLSPFDLKGSGVLPLILTPHEGEFLRLLGTNDKGTIKDRISAVRDFSQKHNVILVLKGERTLIAEASGKVVINPTGNSGLGKAGNGDNLTGIITGFVTQGIKFEVDVFESVVAAVYVAGLAGDIAEKKFGKRTMLASDVRDCLVEAVREVEQDSE